MLCGAADVRDFQEDFKETVREFGGDPWSFLDGSIHHLNSAGADYRANSEMSVRAADLCVFVINREYGEITWNVEMEEALRSGRPFLLLAHEETFKQYQVIRDQFTNMSALHIKSTKLFLAIRDAERRNLTVLPFRSSKFADSLRQGLSIVLQRGLAALEQQSSHAEVASHIIEERDALNAQAQQLSAELLRSNESNLRLRGEIGAHVRTEAELRQKNDRLGHDYAATLAANTQWKQEVDRRRRASVKLVGVAALIALILGAIPSWFLSDAFTRRSSAAEPTASVAARSEPPRPLPQQSSPSWPAGIQEVTLSARECGQNVVQLATVTDELEQAKLIRTSVLIADLNRRFKDARLDLEAHASSGVFYCTESEHDDDFIVLWTGPFESRRLANQATSGMRRKGVCTDCYPVS